MPVNELHEVLFADDDECFAFSDFLERNGWKVQVWLDRDYRQVFPNNKKRVLDNQWKLTFHDDHKCFFETTWSFNHENWKPYVEESCPDVDDPPEGGIPTDFFDPESDCYFNDEDVCVKPNCVKCNRATSFHVPTWMVKETKIEAVQAWHREQRFLGDLVEWERDIDKSDVHELLEKSDIKLICSHFKNYKGELVGYNLYLMSAKGAIFGGTSFGKCNYQWHGKDLLSLIHDYEFEELDEDEKVQISEENTCSLKKFMETRVKFHEECEDYANHPVKVLPDVGSAQGYPSFRELQYLLEKTRKTPYHKNNHKKIRYYEFAAYWIVRFNQTVHYLRKRETNPSSSVLLFMGEGALARIVVELYKALPYDPNTPLTLTAFFIKARKAVEETEPNLKKLKALVLKPGAKIVPKVKH